MFSKKSVWSKLIFPILMILLLSVAGCGSTPSKPNNSEKSSGDSTSQVPTSPAPNSQDVKPNSSTPANGVVTYENYLKIKLDTTYENVKSILGEGKKKAINSDVIDYTWNEQTKTILVQTNKGKVVTKIQSNLGKTTSKLTLDQFNQITTGMTFDQAVSILGPDYQEVSYKKNHANVILRNVVWMLPDSTSIKVYLQDGKVINKNTTLKK
ncbi:DUF3862 domain-containing protein [Desulfosporosinus sp. BG]|uniref:DUF3862 domain-containing protein n=1 Tax=Desulfosporosinus sp. BG TaxID=1633135 RepID=UPI00083B8EE1|nr:DUF3862 domain-containing protein [Desulfosporosinus sp. BG]ODA38746.1 hypothetical protein DSBG_4481 [Desulfosporosinus sp. BG]